MKKESFSPSSLLRFIETLPKPRHYHIAFSGGLDSTVLIHAICKIREELQAELCAIHVNHGLNIHAEEWEKHCRLFCENNNIKFYSNKVEIQKESKKSIEESAREMRYKYLSELMSEGDILLTAHHQEDLAETLLLHLIRGSGPDGLTGIPEIRKFSQGWLARPLLPYNKMQLNEYASKHNIKWIEDDSNDNTDFDRNFIRHRVIPVITERWPSVSDTFSRVARHQGELASILDEIGSKDLEKVVGSSHNSLNIYHLQELHYARLKNLLRYWLKKFGFPIPSSKIIEEIIDNVINAKRDRTPHINWQDMEIRRYRDQLYAMQALPGHNLETEYTWQLDQMLNLDVGQLQACKVYGKGLKTDCIKNNTVKIRFRQGGENICPRERQHTHDLKKLFQEAGIPPWIRGRVPLLYIDNALAEVVGYWIDKKFSANDNEEGWEVKIIKSADYPSF